MTVDIRDVARRCGVSVATVSRALNGRPDVSVATRARVLESARELGYLPNQQARSLVRRKSDTVGLIWDTSYVVDGGRVPFLQDPRTQADWMNGGVEGYAGYKVGDDVSTHELWGGGVYVFNQNNPSIHTENGFEVPESPGVKLHHIMTVNLSAGTIDHVVNGVGGPADTTKIGVPVYINEYPAP